MRKRSPSTAWRSRHERRQPIPWLEAAEAVRPRASAFIDGAFTAAADGSTFADHGPRDGRHLADVARCGAEDVDRAVRAGRRAFDGGAWSRSAPAERRRVLLRLADLVEARVDDLALLESLDVGKPIGDALRVDVPSAAACLRFYGEASTSGAGSWRRSARTRWRSSSASRSASSARSCRGTTRSIITAWKLAPALAAGNSVVLKPAEQSPLSALLLAELAAEAGLPDGVLNVVPGLGPEAGEPLGRHPGVDKIAFTGSVAVGRRFMSYAGESNGKNVALELGGKSPQVVLADVGDLDAAAQAIAWGHLLQRRPDLPRGLAAGGRPDGARARCWSASSPSRPTSSPAIRWTPRRPSAAWWTRRPRHGCSPPSRPPSPVARSWSPEGSGRPPSPAAATCSRRCSTASTASMPIAREEVFGPVLCVQEARDAEDAVALANDTEYGLAAAVWTRDVTTAHRVARAAARGDGVGQHLRRREPDDAVRRHEGASGHGRDRSLHALDAYAQAKTTWVAL